MTGHPEWGRRCRTCLTRPCPGFEPDVTMSRCRFEKQPVPVEVLADAFRRAGLTVQVVDVGELHEVLEDQIGE